MSWEIILKYNNDIVNEVNSRLKDTIDKLHDVLGEPDYTLNPAHSSKDVFYESKGDLENPDKFEYSLEYIVLEDPSSEAYDWSIGGNMGLSYLFRDGTLPMQVGNITGYPSYFVGQFDGELYHLTVSLPTHDAKVEAIAEDFHNYLVSKFVLTNQKTNPTFTTAVDENNNPIHADDLDDNSWRESLRGNE